MRFNLHSLGWHSFQQLCLTIVRQRLGQTVESFLDVHDGGRDGAFSGTWSPYDGEDLTGAFVIQCKFTTRPNQPLRASDLDHEIGKIERLVDRGICDNYILMTNHGISGVHAEDITARILQAGVRQVRVLGSSWIEQQILEDRQLRMLVPRVYGLGDLSQILDERAYAQARTLLESMKEELAKVVVTDSYQRAAQALDNHRFVLLLGDPACGKTTIASMLAMAATDRWKSNVLKLDTPRDVVARWNPDDPAQVFWLDDAFGTVQYEEWLVHEWNHRWMELRAILAKGGRVIMTSRNYIYNRARRQLKAGAFPMLDESQVVVDVHDLSLDERRQMLYSHVKLGRQPASFRTAVKPLLEGVAQHERFRPETARRLGDPMFTARLPLTVEGLSHFVANQAGLLRDVLTNLDGDSRAVLALLYMRNGRLLSPFTATDAEARAINTISESAPGRQAALAALEGGLVSRQTVAGEVIWSFRHPTIGDALGELLKNDSEQLEIFVRGSQMRDLLRQITCGDVDLRGALVVPPSLFDVITERLVEFMRSRRTKEDSRHPRDQVFSFLSSRCSDAFLRLFIAAEPSVIEAVADPGLMLEAASEVSLAFALQKHGVLPKPARNAFVSVVVTYAVQGEDFFALSDPVFYKMMTLEERADLLGALKSELVPNLGEVLWRWKDNCSSDNREEHLLPFLEGLTALRDIVLDDPVCVHDIDNVMQRARDWINEQEEDPYEEPAPDRLSIPSKIDILPTGRSVFDDVDA
jgi:hypothetical protein